MKYNIVLLLPLVFSTLLFSEGSYGEAAIVPLQSDTHIRFLNGPNHNVYWWPDKKGDPPGRLEVNRNHVFKFKEKMQSKDGTSWLKVESLYPIKGTPKILLIPESHTQGINFDDLVRIQERIEDKIRDEVDWAQCGNKSQAQELGEQGQKIAEKAMQQRDYSCKKGQDTSVSDGIAAYIAQAKKEKQPNYMSNPHFDQRFDPSCSYAVLKNQHGHNRYLTCEKKKGLWLAKSKHGPSCIKENYHRVVHNTFTKVTDCFGLPKKTLFSLFALESQFQQNIHSERQKWERGPVGAVGITQLTEQAEKEMFSQADNIAKDHMDLTNPECSSLLKEFNKIKIDRDHEKWRCSRFVAPANPLQNLMLGAVHFIVNQNRIIDEYLKWRGIEVKPEVARIEGLVQSLKDGVNQNKESATQIKPDYYNPYRRSYKKSEADIKTYVSSLQEKYKRIRGITDQNITPEDRKALNAIAENFELIPKKEFQRQAKKIAGEKLETIQGEIGFAREQIDEMKRLRKKYLLDSLYENGTEEDIQIFQELMLYGHNFGQGDIDRYFTSYLKKYPGDQSFEKFSGKTGGFLAHLKSKTKSKSSHRRFEMINYVHVAYNNRRGGGNSVVKNDETLSDFKPTEEEKSLAELNVKCGIFSK